MVSALKIRIPEYKSILALKDKLEPERGKVFTEIGVEELPHYRSTEVRWLTRDNAGWVFSIMQDYARQVQSNLGLDSVLRIVDNIQLSTYHPGDFYDWHDDHRKLSASVLLSDSYTGGRLEFSEPGQPKLQRAGEAVFFLDQRHRVRKVLSGHRDSLVVWWR